MISAMVHFSNFETMKTEPKTRADLARLVPPGAVIIELGVAAGKFAELLLDQNPSAQYVGIDRWSDHHDEAEMDRAKARLWRWRDRVGLIRGSFADHLPLVPDGFADMIYIDGYAHTGQEGGQTLRDWWPKLSPGGIFAGHDYCPQYPQTIEAVNAFVYEMGLENALNIIDEKPHASWWLTKPK
jgi:trans-aconitate methyltransferase